MSNQLSGKVQFHDFHPALSDFRKEVLDGLAGDRKQIEPKFFYDQRGSELFEMITRLPEYYPTRVEMQLLQRHGPEMAQLLGKGSVLLELGSGSSRKIRILLSALRPRIYLPVDISRQHLMESARAIAADFPEMEVQAACADYTRELRLPDLPGELVVTAFFPGSSIGNFHPGEAVLLMQRLARKLGPGGQLLIGVDLKKDPAVIEAAYNDSQQVTAAFNLNLLERINRELGADFDLNAFQHFACYNEDAGRVEMHLRSTRQQRVRVGEHLFEFVAGETIHTENSYKYTAGEFIRLATEAGYESTALWEDEQRYFSVHALRVTA